MQHVREASVFDVPLPAIRRSSSADGLRVKRSDATRVAFRCDRPALLPSSSTPQSASRPRTISPPPGMERG